MTETPETPETTKTTETKETPKKKYSGRGFKPGVSGNPSGRPKTHKLTEADKARFGKDPFAALVWLLESATNKTELRTAALDLIGFVKPALKSVEVFAREDKNITIQLLPPDTTEIPSEALQKIMKDAQPQIIDLDPVAMTDAVDHAKKLVE